MASYFAKGSDPSETEFIAFYLSQECFQQMARCFGSKYTRPTAQKLQNFLIKCLISAPSVKALQKAGILVNEDNGFVKFASLLAEKYYMRLLIPMCALANPSSLHDLISKVIENISVSALRQSAVGDDDFFKGATLQHQFMEGLALYTHPTCTICSELSRVYSASPLDRDHRIDGGIDSYLNGSLRWGIELLVNGDKIGKHMARFALDGQYAALAATDYAVIDFRANRRERATEVTRKLETITVLFEVGDFSTCRCIFGLVEDSDPITLKR